MAKENKSISGAKKVFETGTKGLPPTKQKIAPPKMKPPKKD